MTVMRALTYSAPLKNPAILLEKIFALAQARWFLFFLGQKADFRPPFPTHEPE